MGEQQIVYVNNIIRLYNGHYYAHVSAKPTVVPPVEDYSKPPEGYRMLKYTPRGVQIGSPSIMREDYRTIELTRNVKNADVLFKSRTSRVYQRETTAQRADSLFG